MKISVITIIGTAGSMIATAFGGWNMGLQALVAFMAIDYITGLIVAGVFKKSKKSASGKLESAAGFKGLCRKGAILLMVLVAVQLDRVIGSNFIRNAVIIGYMANEALSIFENVSLMGVDINPFILKAATYLKKKSIEDADITKHENLEDK